MPNRSFFPDDIWNEAIGPRYRDDLSVTGKQIADELGISEATLSSQMRRRGFYRYRVRTRTPEGFALASDRPTPAQLVRFDFDPDQPDACAPDILKQAQAAAADGRLSHFRELLRCAAMVRRGGPEAPSDDAFDPAALDPLAGLTLNPAQRPPDDPWETWLFLGGRGAGKTLAGAAWLARAAMRTGRLALVGATLHDVREVMIHGPSGILALPGWPEGFRPVYEPSRRRLTFPNGAEAFAFSAEDPDSLRGPQFGAAWADEFCAWGRPDETLAMLRMGLRLGDDPRLVVTTTPRPIAALRALKAEPGCRVTHAATRDNAEHLAPGFLARLEALYGGTRRAQQELEGLIVEAADGLFRAEDLARARNGTAPDAYDRIVVAIDPTTTPGGDACGIVVAARRGDRAYVLADRSRSGLTPAAWARRAVAAMDEFRAHAVVAEVNQGGDMVGHTLRTQRGSIRLREVRATVGKRARAEPVSALYEQGRVVHLGVFRELEEELMALGGPDAPRGSLDRADALVWAITDLMLTPARVAPSLRVL